MAEHETLPLKWLFADPAGSYGTREHPSGRTGRCHRSEVTYPCSSPVHQTAKPREAGQYENPLEKPKTGLESVAKARIALKVVEQWDEQTPRPYDLSARVRELVRFIHQSNHDLAPKVRIQQAHR